jgi:hypothetical protein
MVRPRRSASRSAASRPRRWTDPTRRSTAPRPRFRALVDAAPLAQSQSWHLWRANHASICAGAASSTRPVRLAHNGYVTDLSNIGSSVQDPGTTNDEGPGETPGPSSRCGAEARYYPTAACQLQVSALAAPRVRRRWRPSLSRSPSVPRRCRCTQPLESDQSP